MEVVLKEKGFPKKCRFVHSPFLWSSDKMWNIYVPKSLIMTNSTLCLQDKNTCLLIAISKVFWHMCLDATHTLLNLSFVGRAQNKLQLNKIFKVLAISDNFEHFEHFLKFIFLVVPVAVNVVIRNSVCRIFRLENCVCPKRYSLKDDMDMNWRGTASNEYLLLY